MNYLKLPRVPISRVLNLSMQVNEYPVQYITCLNCFSDRWTLPLSIYALNQKPEMIERIFVAAQNLKKTLRVLPFINKVTKQ